MKASQNFQEFELKRSQQEAGRVRYFVSRHRTLYRVVPGRDYADAWTVAGGWIPSAWVGGNKYVQGFHAAMLGHEVSSAAARLIQARRSARSARAVIVVVAAFACCHIVLQRVRRAIRRLVGGR